MSYLKGIALITLVLFAACGTISPSAEKEGRLTYRVQKTEAEWKKILTPEQYRVMRQSDTERAFTGCFDNHWESGVYSCAACKTPLFGSGTKYQSGTGWPSFSTPLDDKNLEYREDNSMYMKRIEVRCAVCGSHLGHVFNDGPPPSQRHYCINSVALDFKPAASEDDTSEENAVKKEGPSRAVFAAGCFWGVEDKFSRIPGVTDAISGYTGGSVPKPDYKQVCSGDTGHAEAVEIVFDPARVSYEQLLDVFFKIHDPTQLDRQGPDVGSQYRSAIFYLDEEQRRAAEAKIAELDKSGRFKRPIATRVVSASRFFQAEEYHQDFYQKKRKK